MIFSLFEGRHELPANSGALALDFDFSTFQVVKSELWDKAILDNDCEVIVTGLTPALTQFISQYFTASIYADTCTYADGTYNVIGRLRESRRLTLWHFNSATKEYVKQVIL